MVFDPVKSALCPWTITLLPEPSYIEIGSCSEVVFRRVSYFIIEEVIVVVRITVDISIAGRVRLIVADVEKAFCVGFARAVGLIIKR